MNKEGTVVLLIDEKPKGYSLTWKNLAYSVVDKKTGSRKHILKNVTGCIEPGSFLAILGASGAGKSTFLDVLASRKSHYDGEIHVNGQNNIPIKHVSRYCTQEDALFGNLTVYETLMYAAKFNMPNSYTNKELNLIVVDLIKELGLELQMNTIIGTPLLKGCSGGQVRRVSVASQMVGMKSGILFLDEPTSGLDSVAAFSVIETMRKLAIRNNSTVMATIHQPSSETFQLFTHVLILGQGSTVFFGRREDAIAHFTKIGRPIPAHSNPSDVYLQMTNVDFDSDRAKGEENVKQLVAAFDQSEQANSIMQRIAEIDTGANNFELKSRVGYKNGFVHQTKTLMHRAFLNAVKNPLSYWIRVAMYVALAILMGTTWWRLGHDQSKVQDRLGALFFSIAFLAFMSVAGIPAFLEERHVFLREKANGLYGVESYVLSNFLVSIPFILIITISFSVVAYFMMGLQQTAAAFWTFVGYLFLSLMIAEAQVVFISIAIPIFVAALAIAAFVNGLWMVVQGFFIQKKNLPSFWRYSFHYLDFQKYGFEGLIKNEFIGNTFNCQANIASTTGCFCSIPPAVANACSFTGEDVLRYFEYTDINDGEWIGIMIAVLVFFKIATYLVLRFQSF